MDAQERTFRAIVFVTDLSRPSEEMTVTGELPGPYTLAEALDQLDAGQGYRLVGDILYARDVHYDDDGRQRDPYRAEGEDYEGEDY